MKLIVGLGNPDEKYLKTRHNLGFACLDKLLEDLKRLDKTFWEHKKDLKSLISKYESLFGMQVILAKPTTFMNNSGLAVKLLLSKYNLNSLDLIVVHDDVDLPLGKIRVRLGGAAGGHKGVMSIIENLKTDQFLRIRLGIGRPIRTEGSKHKTQNYRGIEDYVLSDFTSAEVGKVRTMQKETIRIIKLLVKKGIDEYMGKYNKK